MPLNAKTAGVVPAVRIAGSWTERKEPWSPQGPQPSRPEELEPDAAWRAGFSAPIIRQFIDEIEAESPGR